MCYLVAGLLFVIFYRQNPMYTVLIIGALVGGYFLIKARSPQKNRSGARFRSGTVPLGQAGPLDPTILLLVDHILSEEERSPVNQDSDAKGQKIQSLKKEILALFDE